MLAETYSRQRTTTVVSMSTHPFLSDPWIIECRKLREEYRDRLTGSAVPPLRINLIVIDVPFSVDAPLDAHLDTTSGEPEIELGHLTDPEVTVTVDYSTAKSVFVDGNLGAAMEGLQLGRIKVDGDMLKLMSLAGLQADATSIELAKKIRSLTE